MNVPYPGGGTTPSSLPQDIPAIHEQVVHQVGSLALTGSDVVAIVVAGLVCLFVGLALQSIRRAKR